MRTSTYERRRGEIETYFDRTAVDAWKALTSTGPVSGIRATVRAGRERMRGLLLSWLPQDLSGARLLDAGCGTGALAIEAAGRGAKVVGIDLSPSLIEVARERHAGAFPSDKLQFVAGDMLDESHGRHHHVVAMDSLIHYRAEDMIAALGQLASRCDRSILFTFAPRTPALATMHGIGRLFPRSDRAPSIEPVAELRLRRLIASSPALSAFRVNRAERVSAGFYTSHAIELVRQ
jgi:magnesium-protoporphyrin O-methyltransferase